MKRKLIALALAVSMMVIPSLALTGCGGSSGETADGEEVYVLKWAHVSPDSNDKQADEINETIKKIEEESDGRLVIQHYPNSQLGSETELFEGVQMGTVEIATLSCGSLGSFCPETMATTIPFLFKTREEAWEFFDSEAADWLADAVYDRTGVKVLGWAENGLRCFTATDKQIMVPDDLKGLTIRTQDNPMTMAMVQACGGTPTPIAFGELYTALSQGTVDGQENPPSLIYTNGLYEVQPYLTLDYHIYDFLGVFASEAAIDNLPEDLQVILQENIDEFVQLERERSRAYDERDIQAMEDAGVSVRTLDDQQYQAWVDATASVVDVARQYAGDEAVDVVLNQLEVMRAADEE